LEMRNAEAFSASGAGAVPVPASPRNRKVVCVCQVIKE